MFCLQEISISPAKAGRWPGGQRQGLEISSSLQTLNPVLNSSPLVLDKFPQVEGVFEEGETKTGYSKEMSKVRVTAEIKEFSSGGLHDDSQVGMTFTVLPS